MWTPTSWQSMPQEQQADYPDKQQLNKTIEELSLLPPLVSASEVLELRELTAKAAIGDVFLLQGGDCAESFIDCNQASINRKLQLITQMSLLMMYGLGQPVVRIGRMAGQYAKPRSAHTETIDGTSLPSYRGDLINEVLFCPIKREPDPERLLKGYSLASLTLNYIRTNNKEQIDRFCEPERWQSDAMASLRQKPEYEKTIEAVRHSFSMLKALSPGLSKSLDSFYTCHEALHLHYEQALTRKVGNKWFNLSTHMPWVGMRTAKPDSAHIEYLRGIENPIAIKVGPRMTQKWLSNIIERLNPENSAGRITLITRLGSDKVAKLLPPLIECIKDRNYAVTWVCDPMHGNTRVTKKGIKTRHLTDIVSEVRQSLEIHKSHESVLGGIHLELTGENVTECIGGVCSVSENDLNRAYRTLVDPRLNASQATELALEMVKIFKQINLKSDQLSQNKLNF
ncbi:3-deoxy-7-phosphoheptulonate synthase class II [Pleionea sediminis]|uniref:3-deoxy-7-phosphoheptulonate synthase class II n=1 Tax=Pleionea sediminis TaxID=2569479 RepID=UPI00197B99F4|nr:3-deoxy-7-phosphoheptulonate synthase class II [Pleionea sediminis]